MEKPVMREHFVPSDTPGIQLYLRNKRLESARADRILLFVHGSTYPAETSFDLPLGGVSLMDFLAKDGWDVWLVDLRGYGKSTRPPEMDQPPSANPAIVTTDVAGEPHAACGRPERYFFASQRATAASWNVLPRRVPDQN